MSKKDKKLKKVKSEEVKVFKQFKKQKLIQRIGFICAAFVVGIGFNTFVLSGEYGDRLKTNILESSSPIEDKADIYLEKIGGVDGSVVKLLAGKNMNNVESLSLGIVYNPEIVELQDIFSNINGLELSRLENEQGIATILLDFSESSNILKGKDILNFYINKKEESTQNLNIVNANFIDTTQTNYQLSTSGIAF